MISGPSLRNTSRDVVLIRYAASDAKVAKAMDVVAQNYAQGGAFDAGAPVLKAVRSYANDAERVVLQPRSHVLAVVPTSAAQAIARKLVHETPMPHVLPGEAAYIRVMDPHHAMPLLPGSLTAMELHVRPRDDDGADITIQGTAKDADGAQSAASQLRDLVASYDVWPLSDLTAHLLDHVEITANGAAVNVRVTASIAQIDTIVRLVASQIGVALPPPGGPGAARPPAPGAPR
jgi:hypothetical protein